MNRFDRFVGIPWDVCGRSSDGCDCYGLVRLVLASAGIALPAFGDAYASLQDRRVIASLIDENRSPWQRVQAGEERAMDVALFRERPWHLGVLVDQTRMLHVPEGRSSLIETYRGPKFAARLDGVYRHEALA